MSQDQLRNTLETIRAQIQAELDAQLDSVERQQNEAVEAARQQARDEAEAHWTRELHRVRADWESRLQGDLAAAAGEAERRTISEITRVRVETEQKANESIKQVTQETAAVRAELAQIRAKLEQTHAAFERTRAEHEQAQAGLERTRAEHEETRLDFERTRAEHDQTRLDFERTRAELEQARADFEQARVQLEQTRVEHEQALQSERSGHAAAQAAHADRVAQLQREIDEARRGVEAFEKELGSLRALHDRETGTTRQLLDAESARVRTLSAELSDARRALEGAERDRQALEETARDRQALQDELLALQEEIGAMRQSFDAERKAAHQTLEHERTAARQAVEAQTSHARETADARAAERQSQLVATERLLGGVRAISDARSLSDVLAALVDGAATEASRAALLVPAGSELQGFRTSGFGPDAVRHPSTDRKDDVLQTALRERQSVPVTPASAPAFASLLKDRAGLAVPITVGGQAVAVLYADNNAATSPQVPASWPEAVEILCHHAAAAVAHLTAVRTTQAMRLMRPGSSRPAHQSAAVPSDADQEAARRYARLLVSEIKLYNESAVRIGREKRDLLNRLRPEVERARRLYEERVSSTVAGRAHYFEQELRQTLADGDASLLGPQAVPR